MNVFDATLILLGFSLIRIVLPIAILIGIGTLIDQRNAQYAN